MYLRGVSFKKSDYSLTIVYENVGGLRAGSPIMVAGYTVGKVEDMQLYGAGIAVQASIESDVHLPKDSQALIKSASIMGANSSPSRRAIPLKRSQAATRSAAPTSLTSRSSRPHWHPFHRTCWAFCRTSTIRSTRRLAGTAEYCVGCR